MQFRVAMIGTDVFGRGPLAIEAACPGTRRRTEAEKSGDKDDADERPYVQGGVANEFAETKAAVKRGRRRKRR